MQCKTKIECSVQCLEAHKWSELKEWSEIPGFSFYFDVHYVDSCHFNTVSCVCCSRVWARACDAITLQPIFCCCWFIQLWAFACTNWAYDAVDGGIPRMICMLALWDWEQRSTTKRSCPPLLFYTSMIARECALKLRAVSHVDRHSLSQYHLANGFGTSICGRCLVLHVHTARNSRNAITLHGFILPSIRSASAKINLGSCARPETWKVPIYILNIPII